MKLRLTTFFIGIAILTTNIFSQVPAYVPTSGLVGYWPFNGNANDESGNGNNGLTGSGVALTTDRFLISNSAYDFNGSGNISLTSLPTMGSQDFSISGWIKTNNLTLRKGIACWGQDSPWNSTYFYITDNGYLKFDFAYNGGPQSPIFVADNNWHSVIVTCTGGLIQLYLDGAATGTALTMSPNISGANKSIGANIDNSGSNNFVGLLDDIGIWNRALTNCEVTHLFDGLNSVNVNAGNDQTICAGTSVTLSGTGANTYSWNNSVNNGVAFTPSASTTYTVTGTNTATGCTNTDQVVVTVNTLPTVNAGIDQTVCAGTSVTLSGTGANTYSWNNSVNNGVAFTPSSNTTYTVIGTNTSTGCTNTDQVVVNVSALPTVNAGIDQTVCAGTAVTLSGTGASTYSWNNSVNNAVAFMPSSNTTYTVTGTNTATGCTSTDQVAVTVNALPTVNAGIDQAVCTGTAVTLSGTGANTYSWNNSVNNGVSFTPTTTTTYTVTGTNSATGCANTDQVVVNVNALPTVNAGIDQTVCAGTAVTLSGTGASTYSWNNSVNNGVAFTPTSNTTYTVTGTNTVTGCANTDQVVVTVNALPTVNAGIDQTVCAGTAATLSGTGANTYSWNNSVSNGIAFTPSASTTYTVTGTNTATGCASTDQVVVTVNALPTVNAGIDQTVCAGTAVTLSGTGANTYSWNNSVNNGVAFMPTSNTTYTVTGTNTATGCTNTDQVVVTVNTLPTVNAGMDQTVCMGDNVILNGSGAATYSWDNVVIDGVSFVPSATEIYHLQATDVNGCQGIDSVQVIVNSTSASILTETALDSYTLNNQTYTQSGTYTQVILNAAGCDSTITLNLTLNHTGIEELNNLTISIYPNPSYDILFINSEIELFSSFELIDNQGRIVLHADLKGKKTSVNIESIAPGNYYLQIEERKIAVTIVKQ